MQALTPMRCSCFQPSYYGSHLYVASAFCLLLSRLSEGLLPHPRRAFSSINKASSFLHPHPTEQRWNFVLWSASVAVLVSHETLWKNTSGGLRCQILPRRMKDKRASKVMGAFLFGIPPRCFAKNDQTISVGCWACHLPASLLVLAAWEG